MGTIKIKTMKKLITVSLMACLFSVNSFAQYQQKTSTDTSYQYYNFKAGKCIQNGADKESGALLLTLVGSGIVAASSFSNNNTKTTLIMGCAVLAVGVVLYFNGSALIGKGGKYLQMASGRFPINYSKK